MPTNNERGQVVDLLRRNLSTRLDDPEEDIECKHLVNDLGLDSLDVVTLLFDIEDRFGVVVPEDQIAAQGLLNVGNLLEFVLTSLDAKS